ncbi:MAG: type II CRISPR-associated endonuclease Cas1 [Muribaculaceae bacterium]|nr:type II CRISPR-associated endonuclease Cas1 [Muribaculaceae bacterium]
MIKKTLCFSNNSYLSLKNGQLVIDSKSNAVFLTRPIEDIGIIILESKMITLTSALLNALLENNVAVIVCDDRHMPSGIMLPLIGNSLLTEYSRSQLTATLPLKKQLWQQTVVAKISNQAALLKREQKETGCMEKWSSLVRSGDPDNLEARAAIYYWKNFFSHNPLFKRGDDSFFENSLLNYGYAILRAVIARSIVSAGLIPHLGLFHSNKYNPYCLADDLMEPYRPFVDDLVKNIIENHKANTELTTEINLSKEIKQQLLSIPVLDVHIGKTRRPLMIAANQTATSLVDCFRGEKRKITYPVL